MWADVIRRLFNLTRMLAINLQNVRFRIPQLMGTVVVVKVLLVRRLGFLFSFSCFWHYFVQDCLFCLHFCCMLLFLKSVHPLYFDILYHVVKSSLSILFTFHIVIFLVLQAWCSVFRFCLPLFSSSLLMMEVLLGFRAPQLYLLSLKGARPIFYYNLIYFNRSGNSFSVFPVWSQFCGI